MTRRIRGRGTYLQIAEGGVAGSKSDRYISGRKRKKFPAQNRAFGSQQVLEFRCTELRSERHFENAITGLHRVDIITLLLLAGKLFYVIKWNLCLHWLVTTVGTVETCTACVDI